MQSSIDVSTVVANLSIMENNVIYIMQTCGNSGNVSLRYGYFLNDCASRGQELLNFIDFLKESILQGDYSVYGDYLNGIQVINSYISQYS
jgi:hypothetical protein